MKVLIACEFSGTVRDAFAARGHYARSCDLLPTERIAQRVKFRCDYGCIQHETFDESCDDCQFDEPYCHDCDCYAWDCNCMGPTEDEAEYGPDEWELKGARHLAGDLFSVESIESYDLLIAHPPCTHLAVSGARWLKRHWVKKGNGGYWHDPTEKLKLQAESVEFVKRIANLPVKRIAIENPVSMLSRFYRKPDQIVQPWQFGHGETKATCFWLQNLPRLQPTNIVEGRENRIHRMPPSPDRWKERSRTYTGIAQAMAEQWSS